MGTLSEKVWDRHVVHAAPGEPDLLYIDLHLVHEVTSPQAFDGLRIHGRAVRRPDLSVATMDHNVPTVDVDQPIADPVSARQIEVLARTCEACGFWRNSALPAASLTSMATEYFALDSSSNFSPATSNVM